MTEVRDELFRLIWLQVRGWNADNITNLPAARRLVEAGASTDELAVAMNAAAYEMAFGVLELLDERGDPERDAENDSWALIDPNSRVALDGLHEDFLMADPTGNEGRDLFA